MKRHEWTFNYTASELREAATKQRDHRASRLTWWKAKMDEVMAEVRATGIEINESIVSSYSNKMGHAPEVMVRNDLQTKLGEAHQRIQLHDKMQREYDGWVQVMTACPPTLNLALNNDDWLYFFGKND